MAKFQIQVRYAKGWRKANRVSSFLLHTSAEEYARKYLLAGWWRVVEIEELALAAKRRQAAFVAANAKHPLPISGTLPM